VAIAHTPVELLPFDMNRVGGGEAHRGCPGRGLIVATGAARPRRDAAAMSVGRPRAGPGSRRPVALPGVPAGPVPSERFFQPGSDEPVLTTSSTLDGTGLDVADLVCMVSMFLPVVPRMRSTSAVGTARRRCCFGWRRPAAGAQGELSPSFQRAAAHLAVLKKMTGISRTRHWLVLSVVANGIVHVIAFILLDQDLVGHDRPRWASIRAGSHLWSSPPSAYPDAGEPSASTTMWAGPWPPSSRWHLLPLWYYNMMTEPNRHFYANWAQEDALALVIAAMR